MCNPFNPLLIPSGITPPIDSSAIIYTFKACVVVSQKIGNNVTGYSFHLIRIYRLNTPIRRQHTAYTREHHCRG